MSILINGIKTLRLKFRGIDSWNRPIFKDVDSKSHYGDLFHLFSFGTSYETIKEFYKNVDEDINENLKKCLEYTGEHFDCEPNGGQIRKEVKVELMEK